MELVNEISSDSLPSQGENYSSTPMSKHTACVRLFYDDFLFCFQFCILNSCLGVMVRLHITNDVLH